MQGPINFNPYIKLQPPTKCSCFSISYNHWVWPLLKLFLPLIHTSKYLNILDEKGSSGVRAPSEPLNSMTFPWQCKETPWAFSTQPCARNEPVACVLDQECNFVNVMVLFQDFSTFLKISMTSQSWKSIIQIPWLFQVSMTTWPLQ